MLTLTALPYSPWSEKARWALDHHRIAYKHEDYLPVVGELKLRMRLRRMSGRVTVPVLHDGHQWITDSFDIARYAEEKGSGAPLFPADKEPQITEWNLRSEAALAAGRALLILSMADNPDFALGLMPVRVPSLLRPVMAPLGKKALESFIKKYRMRDEAESHEGVYFGELDRLEKTLAGRRYLLEDTFSYADITMAMLVQGISPVDDRYMAKLPGVPDHARNDEMRRRYASLIAWRDELYQKHRKPGTSA